MSSLNYNSQQLSYISTQSINHEPQYSEDGADYLHTEITIAVQAVINAALEPALGGETATQTMVRIRHKLLEPRRQLIFGVGADELIRSPAAGRVLDAKNGPIPQSLNIRKIGGSETYLIDYVIKTWVVECPEGTAGLSYVSHRWSDQVSIDQDFKTTRTRTGLIIARSDMLTNADSLRGIVATGTILPGFRRESSNYVLSKDGLQLQYTFVDKEVYLQAPAPAVRSEGYYQESTPEGAKRFAECHVKLYGAKPKDTDTVQNSKQVLLQLAVAIAASKIFGPGKNPPQFGEEGKPVLKGAAIREDLYENNVEVTLKADLAIDKKRFTGVPMNLERFTAFPLGSDNSTPAPDPGTRGSAGLTLVAAALRDPCLAVTDPRTAKLVSSTTRGTFPPAALVYLTDAIPTDQAALHNTQTDGVYDGDQMKTEYKVKTNSRMLSVMTDDPAKAGLVRVDLGATELYRQTRWSAMKTGSKPKMPSPAVAANDTNMHLLAFDIDVDAAEPAGDGVSIKYKRSGIMIHGYSDPSIVGLTGGLMPWVDDRVATLTGEQVENFVPTITNPQSSTVSPGQSPFSKLTGWRQYGSQS